MGMTFKKMEIECMVIIYRKICVRVIIDGSNVICR